MKRQGLILLPPGWDASPSQGYPLHSICPYPFIYLSIYSFIRYFFILFIFLFCSTYITYINDTYIKFSTYVTLRCSTSALHYVALRCITCTYITVLNTTRLFRHDASPSLPGASRYSLYTWVERGTVKIKCSAQEHNTTQQQTDTTRSLHLAENTADQNC